MLKSYRMSLDPRKEMHATQWNNGNNSHGRLGPRLSCRSPRLDSILCAATPPTVGYITPIDMTQSSGCQGLPRVAFVDWLPLYLLRQSNRKISYFRKSLLRPHNALQLLLKQTRWVVGGRVCNSYSSATPTADAQAVVACRIFCARAQLYVEMKLIQWRPPGSGAPPLTRLLLLNSQPLPPSLCPSLQRVSYLGLLAFHLSAAPCECSSIFCCHCLRSVRVVFVAFLPRSSSPSSSPTPASCSLAFYLGFLPLLPLLA